MSDSVRPHRRQLTRLPCPWDSPGKNTGVGCHFLLQCMKVKSESEVAQSCPTLSDPMDCSLPGSSVHGIFQARVLEWGAIAFSANQTYELEFAFCWDSWADCGFRCTALYLCPKIWHKHFRRWWAHISLCLQKWSFLELNWWLLLNLIKKWTF